MCYPVLKLIRRWILEQSLWMFHLRRWEQNNLDKNWPGLLYFEFNNGFQYFIPYLLGVNSRLCDSISGRCGVLPSIQCHHLCGQCRERPSLYSSPCSDNFEEHSWNQDFAWDPGWKREHIKQYAGRNQGQQSFFNEYEFIYID